MDAITEIQNIIERSGLTEAEKRTVEQIADVLLRIQEEARRTEEEIMQDRICKLECNIDDCTGESLGFTMEKLFI